MYRDFLIFDYADGTYIPLKEYQTKDQLFTLIDHIITGKRDAVLLVYFLGGRPKINFGCIAVMWPGVCRRFLWKNGVENFKKTFEEAVSFIEQQYHSIESTSKTENGN
jgi:hypothetical protein